MAEMPRKMKKIEVMHNHAYQTISELFGFMHQVPQTRHRNVTTKGNLWSFSIAGQATQQMITI